MPSPQTSYSADTANKAVFIWQVTDDLLRSAFKAHQYGDVALPFVVLRRLDLVLKDRKYDVLAA